MTSEADACNTGTVTLDAGGVSELIPSLNPANESTLDVKAGRARETNSSGILTSAGTGDCAAPGKARGHLPTLQAN